MTVAAPTRILAAADPDAGTGTLSGDGQQIVLMAFLLAGRAQGIHDEHCDTGFNATRQQLHRQWPESIREVV